MSENENYDYEHDHDGDCDDGCEGCGSDCDSCGGCSHGEPGDMHVPFNAYSSVRHVIGIVSGKGGVGKSLVTSMLAVSMSRQGFKTAIMDADMTGPSIPMCFGVKGPAMSNEYGILPAETKTGIKLTSINLFLENETDPVVWRGVVIGNTAKQFWTDILWGDLDYMFIDMPPGTGDVPLTVFQSVQVDGIIVVTSPQELVSMIVHKAVKMAEMMNIPVLGIVENMSYFTCDECGKRHSIFGESSIDSVAEEHGLKVIGKLPIRPDVTKACDSGTIEDIQFEEFSPIADFLVDLDKKP